MSDSYIKRKPDQQVDRLDTFYKDGDGMSSEKPHCFIATLGNASERAGFWLGAKLACLS